MKRVVATRMVIAALVGLMPASGQARAQQLIYEFSGILPDYATITSDYVGVMQPGDAWVARLLVHLPQGDLDSDPDIGYYHFGQDHWGQITFSRDGSDYYTDDVIGTLNVFLYNDYYHPVLGVTYDMLLFDLRSDEDPGNFGIGSGLSTSDLSTFASDALPSHPTEIIANEGDNYALFYGDWDASVVAYVADVDSPVMFRTVPEPSTVVLWSTVGLIGGIMAWRRRKRA